MSKIYSNEIKQKARNLRSKGWSLGEISLKMVIPKNTLSGWVKDISLTGAQKKRIKRKEISSAAMGRTLAIKLMRERKEEWKEKIKAGVKHFGKLPQQNAEVGRLICGLMYLCEGAKYPSTRSLVFSNSNPRIICSFLELLRKYHDIKEDKLRCRVARRWDQNSTELNMYWSNITGIPIKHFFKTQPDKRTKGKPTQRMNYKGVCSIQYSDVSLQFKLQAIGEAVINGAEGD